MQCHKNIVVAALTGILMGTLMGAGTAYYAQVVAWNAPNANFAKEQTITTLFHRIQLRGEGVRSAAEDVPEHCLGLGGRRGLLCRENYNQGVLYQLQDFRSR
ncbi:MAG: hypothetical protein WCX61_02375 [Candidatus Peribacteraceae bacterium]